MKKIIYSLLTFMIMLWTGCSQSFLEEEPHLSSSNELVLSDYEGLNQATGSAYGALDHQSYYGGNFTITADLRAGNAKPSPKSSGRYQTDYNWVYSKSSTSPLWSIAYSMILRVNNVINAIDKTYNPAADPNYDEANINHLKAECLFLRALYYFDLVRVYAQPYTYKPEGLGVPIVLEASLNAPPRNTTREVYKQIITDLTTSIPLFNANFESRGGDPKGWATADAATALLARVYLYMGDYSNAVKYASEIIESGKYTLYTPENYITVWDKDAQSEVIFEAAGDMGNANNPYWENIGYIYYPDGSYGDVCATDNLLSLFDANDVRKTVFQTSDKYPGYSWPAKYPGKNGEQRVSNIVLLRLSEMYLIRIEAGLKGKVTGVGYVADYNTLRAKRGLTGVTMVTEDDLFNERRRELCFEGHLVFDYARWGKSLTRTDELPVLFTGNGDVPFPSTKWALPIPLGEMDANPNMVQNEGY